MKLDRNLHLVLVILVIVGAMLSTGLKEKNNLSVQILETWNIHNEMNLLLLQAISSDYLNDYSASGGRNVGEQFAHIHDNRIEWLKEIAPDEVKTLAVLNQAGNTITKEQLHTELTKSGLVIKKILTRSFSEETLKKITSRPVVFLGYLISHESHHRGQIVLSLKQSQHPLPEKVTYSLWDWSLH